MIPPPMTAQRLLFFGLVPLGGSISLDMGTPRRWGLVRITPKHSTKCFAGHEKKGRHFACRPLLRTA
jgi:hypothetical protein